MPPAKTRKARSTSSGARKRKADRATQYALDVTAGKIVAGPKVRLACSRHLTDLKTGAKRGLEFRVDEAERVFSFFEDVLRLNGGEFEGEPFTLEDWQAFIVGALFGWHTKDGRRRFRRAYIEIGKGNGKSPLAAGIGLYGLVADGEPRAEIYAAATKKDQADILFRDAVAMVDQSRALADAIQKTGINPVKQLTDLESGSWFKPISSDDGQSGPRPHIAIVDEVHEHKSPDVINMLAAGFKGRRNPLMIEITNSGVDKLSICYEHHEFSARVLEGRCEENENGDAWFFYVCGLDEDDDPFRSEKVWPKANPNLGVSISLKYLHEQVAAARGMPSLDSHVRRLNFCEWVDAANPWISGDLWKQCEHSNPFRADLVGTADEPAPIATVTAGYVALSKRRPPVGALDLSGARDLTALALAWEPEKEGDPVRAMVEFWTPKDTLSERSKKERVPFDVWVKAGHVTATPGRGVDYAFVAERLVELNATTGLERVAFDPYRIKYLETELDKLNAEIRLIPHAQGYYKAADDQEKDADERKRNALWMPRSIELLEADVTRGALYVLRNPALTYCSASAVLEADPKGNRIFTKRKSKGRIDGIVALAMVRGLLEIGESDNEPGIVIL